MADPALKDQIAEQLRSAMRSGDKVRVGALRLLTAAIKNREVEVGHELSDDEVRQVAARQMKQRTESIEAFEAAGRRELAEKERSERETIAGFAPTLLTDAEVDALVDEALASTGATSERELGTVMGAVMARAKGRVDGAIVQRKVRERLSAS